jgi:hypothetical protein
MDNRSQRCARPRSKATTTAWVRSATSRRISITLRALNSGLLDGQLGGDFPVALTADQRGQDFTLARAELTVRHTGGQDAGDRGRQEIASGMHLSQSFHEHFVRHPFDEVPRSAGFETGTLPSSLMTVTLTYI